MGQVGDGCARALPPPPAPGTVPVVTGAKRLKKSRGRAGERVRHLTPGGHGCFRDRTPSDLRGRASPGRPPVCKVATATGKSRKHNRTQHGRPEGPSTDGSRCPPRRGLSKRAATQAAAPGSRAGAWRPASLRAGVPAKGWGPRRGCRGPRATPMPRRCHGAGGHEATRGALHRQSPPPGPYHLGAPSP